jgi:hypothetical protein
MCVPANIPASHTVECHRSTNLHNWCGHSRESLRVQCTPRFPRMNWLRYREQCPPWPRIHYQTCLIRRTKHVDQQTIATAIINVVSMHRSHTHVDLGLHRYCCLFRKIEIRQHDMTARVQQNVLGFQICWSCVSHCNCSTHDTINVPRYTKPFMCKYSSAESTSAA